MVAVLDGLRDQLRLRPAARGLQPVLPDHHVHDRPGPLGYVRRHALPLPGPSPFEGLQYRLRGWLPECDCTNLSHLIVQNRRNAAASSAYLAMGVLRMCTRGVCTSARFHSAPRGCIFGCSCREYGFDMSRDYDDLRHYKFCHRFREICVRWMGSLCPIAPVTIPWIATILQLYPLPANVSLLCACMRDAFLYAHHAARLGLPGTPAQAFEARLRLLSRRHQAVANAWGECRAGPGWIVPG